MYPMLLKTPSMKFKPLFILVPFYQGSPGLKGDCFTGYTYVCITIHGITTNSHLTSKTFMN